MVASSAVAVATLHATAAAVVVMVVHQGRAATINVRHVLKVVVGTVRMTVVKAGVLDAADSPHAALNSHAREMVHLSRCGTLY